MDLRQLEFFLAVADEGTFTRAAERTFVTQPGLSSSIRALERELRVRLFDRGRAGASLTRAGEVFLPRAQRMLGDARAAQRELLADAGDRSRPVQLGSARTRSVRVGAEQCLGDLVDMADLMAAFSRLHPTAELSYTQAPTTDLLGLLRGGGADVALVARAWDEGGEPPGVLLRREPFVLLVPPASVLSGRSAVRWAELADLRFVDLAPAFAARQVLDTAWAAQGRARDTVAAVGDVHMLLNLVARGTGVAAVPESIAAKPEAQDLHALRIDGPPLGWEIFLAAAEHAAPPARAFAAMLVPYTAVTDSRSELGASA